MSFCETIYNFLNSGSNYPIEYSTWMYYGTMHYNGFIIINAHNMYVYITYPLRQYVFVDKTKKIFLNILAKIVFIIEIKFTTSDKRIN